MNRFISTFCLTLLAALVFMSGCRSAYYATWEKFGKHKRDILKDNVKKARDEQKEASEQFKDALTQLKELYGFEGGKLEKAYNDFKREYDQSNQKATAVRSRIKQMDTVARDLFSEWEKEIKSMQSPDLRAKSRSKLSETRNNYEQLYSAMKEAEESMEPVLAQLKDQVLYLKHNLNAQALGTLQNEAGDIEREIQQLLDDMSSSISRADTFIETLP